MTDEEEPKIEPDVDETVNDVADRLSRLMRRIEGTAAELRFNNDLHSGLQRPLHEVFEPLAEELGFSNYAELRDNFVALCNRVVRDISALKVRRPETQARWIASAKHANRVFDASNFSKSCQTVFNEHFSQNIYDRLEDASERLQTNGLHESSPNELNDALDAARSVMNAYEKEGEIPTTIARVIKHYLQQIEDAYKRYDDFGEEIFWASYKELFATFVQVHRIILPDEQSKEVNNALNAMADKMTLGLRALAVSADVMTIAATGAAVLKIAAG